ncbi:MAG: hypothetical protein NT167_23435, partial [Verrucomicrobia bacterium]|nr:hypothetical protein [Verrucomicrobiota bacterium]
PIIRLQDAYGNFATPTASSLSVTMSLSQGSGTLSGTKVLDIGSSAGNGTVTYTDLSIDTGGTDKTLTASANGLTAAVSDLFEVTQNQPPVFTGTVATVVETIKSFGAATPSGMNPSGSLILGADGALYGTTEFGGDDAEGTVFAVNPDGTGFRVVHGFAEEGENPESGGEYPRAAVLEVGGALYGTTYAGGDSSVGTVFKVNKDGTGFVILHQFAGESAGDGSHPAAALIVGISGALYGVTEDGGMDDLGTVFTLATDGSGYSILHSFTACVGWRHFGELPRRRADRGQWGFVWHHFRGRSSPGRHGVQAQSGWNRLYGAAKFYQRRRAWAKPGLRADARPEWRFVWRDDLRWRPRRGHDLSDHHRSNSRLFHPARLRR